MSKASLSRPLFLLLLSFFLPQVVSASSSDVEVRREFVRTRSAGPLPASPVTCTPTLTPQTFSLPTVGGNVKVKAQYSSWMEGCGVTTCDTSFECSVVSKTMSGTPTPGLPLTIDWTFKFNAQPNGGTGSFFIDFSYFNVTRAPEKSPPTVTILQPSGSVAVPPWYGSPPTALRFKYSTTDPAPSSGVRFVRYLLRNKLGQYWDYSEFNGATYSWRYGTPTWWEYIPIDINNGGILPGQMIKLGPDYAPNRDLFPPGTYTLELRVKDFVGNESPITKKSFILDIREPTVILSHPNVESLQTIKSLGPIAGFAADDLGGGGLASVYVGLHKAGPGDTWWDGSAWSPYFPVDPKSVTALPVSNQTGGYWKVTKPLPSGANLPTDAGYYQVYVRACDKAGNCTGDKYYYTFLLGSSGVEVKLDPAPANNIYVILPAAPPAPMVMPTIKASARIVGLTPDPTASVTFTWKATLYTFDGQRALVDLTPDLAALPNTTGAAAVTLKLKTTSAIRGGYLTLTASATLNGRNLVGFAPAGLIVNGRNPVPSAVQAVIDSEAQAQWGTAYQGVPLDKAQDALKKIACHESSAKEGTIFFLGQRQFRGPQGTESGAGQGVPIVSFDNGAGIFQVTKADSVCKFGVFAASCRDSVFNWRTNVKYGVTILKEKVPGAKGFPELLRASNAYRKYIVQKINPARKAVNLPEIPITSSTGATLPLPAPAFTPGQLLRDTVRAFNGYGACDKRLYREFEPTLPVCARGVPLHEYKPSETYLKTAPVASLFDNVNAESFWEQVPGTVQVRGGLESSANYVNNVMDKTLATCSTTAAAAQSPAGNSPEVKAMAGSQVIELQFASQLDSVNATQFRVAHNGADVRIRRLSYDWQTHTVRLTLDRQMAEWDEVVVNWELTDLYANPLKGEVYRQIKPAGIEADEGVEHEAVPPARPLEREP